MSNKFTQKAQNTLNHALNIARELGHTYIGSEHILLGLLAESDSIASRLLTSRGADPKKLRRTVIDISGVGSRSQVTPADMTPRAKRVIEASAAESARSGNNYIGTEHILYALLAERDCVAVRLLEAEGIPASEVIGDLNSFISASSGGKAEKQAARQDGRGSTDDRLKIKGAPMLSAHGRDLTAAALDGKLDPLIGRQKETERLIQILSRRTKNNPCLIGEPGVGKTAVVEGLAERIVTRRVPDSLIGKRIVTLNIPSMIAGAKYRGEFEDRMKTVMEEAEKNPDIILFIDEIHVIIGAGAAEGAVDAANIIKPALARGQLQVIGATTISEYRARIEKDSALERRFQSVYVSEPTEAEALEILTGLRGRYEAHHRLTISDEALEAAIAFSTRYIPDRFLPDKAIDLIDEAASKVRIASNAQPPTLSLLEGELADLSAEKERAVECQDFELAANVRDREIAVRRRLTEAQKQSELFTKGNTPTVTKANIADVVTEWTGIPVNRILEDENRKLLSLESNLCSRVVGQEEAISAVSLAIRRGRIGFKNPRRPIGSFIFIGRTGVGKTELSAALAAEIFGSEKALIKLDMSEYMEKHSVSRLIGSPPGYVGYEDGGQLTERIRRRPYAVVLFDEIEKAHPDVFNLLLQILEDGSLTDSQGRRADFSNAVIIMTSNAGAGEGRRVLGFSDSSDAEKKRSAEKSEMLAALKARFRPEFLNRVDEIIVFRSLEPADIEKIAKNMLSEISERAKLLELELSFTDGVPEYLSRLSDSQSFGARQLRRDITRLIENPLSEEYLEGKINKDSRVLATVCDGNIVFKTVV